MKWFRMHRGRVLGILEMPEALARKNLRPGQTLRPFEGGIDPRRQRFVKGGWTHPEPDPDPGYEFWRRTGYPSISDQVGAMMKLLSEMATGDESSFKEFEALQKRIARTKADHPK